MKETVNRFLWDDCHTIEEQRARVFRRWIADPRGDYNNRWDNERLVALAIEFMVQPLFMRSEDERLHEYWSDGIVHFECLNREMADLKFSGTSIFSDRHANHEWFAPFELDIRYKFHSANMPASLNLRFGEPDSRFPIARIPLGTHSERRKTAMCVHSGRPASDDKWAVNLSFDPYTDG
ncbi:hypothetical protein OAG34_00875 [bacterium]|nr:hypothetical protein [bacterium]